MDWSQSVRTFPLRQADKRKNKNNAQGAQMEGAQMDPQNAILAYKPLQNCDS